VARLGLLLIRYLHLLIPVDFPILGIYSRLKCARAGYSVIQTESPLPTVIIYEIHHHRNISFCLSTSSPSVVMPVERLREKALCHRARL
jgi:hypothetical protein